MEKEIIEMCIKTVGILNQLKDSGKITQEQFEEHTKFKLQFINQALAVSKV